MVPEKYQKSFSFRNLNCCVTAADIFNRQYFTENTATKTNFCLEIISHFNNLL